MAKGAVIKHTRKAGAFLNGELAAGEFGVDVSNKVIYFSINGTTVDVVGGADLTNYALKSYVDTAIANAIDAAPAALDTLNELAAALGDDANFAATVTTALAGKAPTSHTHSAADITSGTMNNANVTIDGGTI